MPFLRERSQTPLSFRSPEEHTVINCVATEYNILYVIPELDDACLILTRIIESNFYVLTTYFLPEYYNFHTMPKKMEESFVEFKIRHTERNHCLAMHKRNAPFDLHTHFGLRHDIDPEAITPLLRYLLLPLPVTSSRSKSIEQLFKAVKYFIRNPTEPGIYFENGHYALKDGYNPKSAYPHGPYKLKKNRFSLF